MNEELQLFFHNFVLRYGLWIMTVWAIGVVVSFVLFALVRVFLPKKVSLLSIFATPKIIVLVIPLLVWFLLIIILEMIFGRANNKSIVSLLIDPFLCGLSASIYFIGKNVKGTHGIHLWILVLLLVIAGSIIYLIPSDRLFLYQSVHAKYHGGIEFIGSRKTTISPTTFSSVRVKGENGQPIHSDCPLIFHWQDHQFRVSDITTGTLIALGVDVEPLNYKGPDWQFAFIGDADWQKRYYAVGFDFQTNRIMEFKARYSQDSSVACPFELSRPDCKPVRFPLSEDELKKAFGAPQTISWAWRE